MYDNYNNGYGAPNGGGIPNGNGNANVNGGGAPNGDGTPNGYGVANGYGAPNGYGVPNGYGAPNGYGVPNGYGAPNGYRVPSGYGAPNGYRVPSGYGTPIGYGMPMNFGAPMMSKEQFFKQPQYNGKIGAITFGAVTMYLSAFAGMIIAILSESVENVFLIIFSIVMGIVIQINKNSVCAIISSIFYGFLTSIYLILDFIFLFVGAVAIFDLIANDALSYASYIIVILVIWEVFAAFLPLAGSIAASVATVKMNGDWEKYKMSFYRRGFY